MDRKGWSPDREKEEILTRLGYQEGSRLLTSAEPDTIDRIAKFSLREYVDHQRYDADPRRLPDPIVREVYRSFISKFSLGFVNTSFGLRPTNQMMSFFEGVERSARAIHEDLQKVKRKKKTAKSGGKKKK
jgi:hypothetical protein